MNHVAIMKKSWKLLPKILSGEKVIESRWYLNKSAPWGKIKKGDTVYFKNSGEPVTVKAGVKKIKQFENLTPKIVREILTDYGNQDGIDRSEIQKYYELFKNKKYCVLVSLKNPQKIKPFEIDKNGFGAMSAWICVNSIEEIRNKLF
jgi:ASC-1-like (ASCH) protein